MSRTLDILRQDHLHFETLLVLLDSEAGAFQMALKPDYDFLQAMIEYFSGYPDQVHHPVEDKVLERLRHRNPEAAESIGDLEKQHKKEADRLRTLASAIEDILADREIERETFINAADAFSSHLHHHMEMEEDRFFTVADQVLTNEDWAELDTLLTHSEDSIFRHDAAGDYDALKDRLIEWHRSRQ